jgi:carbamoyltransferase
LINGKLIAAAAEQERFRRIKHWTGFPSEAIKYCIDEAGVEVKDICYNLVRMNIMNIFCK